jgi:hypothetical protein
MWKGDPAPERFVTARTDGGSCGVTFEVGDAHLIYASGPEDRLETNMCNRPRRLDRAWADLLLLGQPQPIGDASALWIPDEDAMFDSLSSEDEPHRYAAEEALRFADDRRVVSEARAIVRGERAGDRLMAIRLIGDKWTAGADAKPELCSALEDSSGRIRAAAVSALARIIRPADLDPCFQTALRDSDPAVITVGLQLVHVLRRADSAPDWLMTRLVELWSHTDPHVRQSAIEVFGAQFPARVKEHGRRLKQVARDDAEEWVRNTARSLLDAKRR